MYPFREEETQGRTRKKENARDRSLLTTHAHRLLGGYGIFTAMGSLIEHR